jgi:hypothetical protein
MARVIFPLLGGIAQGAEALSAIEEHGAQQRERLVQSSRRRQELQRVLREADAARDDGAVARNGGGDVGRGAGQERAALQPAHLEIPFRNAEGPVVDIVDHGQRLGGAPGVGQQPMMGEPQAGVPGPLRQAAGHPVVGLVQSSRAPVVLDHKCDELWPGGVGGQRGLSAADGELQFAGADIEHGSHEVR